MRCPICGAKTRVNRTDKMGKIIVRHRVCTNSECNYKFKTTEEKK
jgi:transcriptional regulator NrdR family protein